MADRTLVASATNLLARGFLVVPTDRRSPQGEPVNALFAVARALHRVVAFKVPARAVAVLDAEAGATWPPLLKAQLAPLAGLIEALGIRVVEVRDEAHVVASYARAALDGGDDVIVVGMDKRFAQLVSDRLWWYDANKDARYTPEIVQKRFQVPPAKVAEWLALVGDDDALPGVAGIGAKGATGVIESHGSVERALEVADTIPGRTGKVLRASGDAVRAELRRARLDQERPLPVALDALPYAPPRPAALNSLCERLGFVELLAAEGASIRVRVCDTVAELEAALAGLGDEAVAVHPVIEDPAPLRGALAGLALSTGRGDALYAPLSGLGPCLPGPHVLAAWLEDPAAAKLAHAVEGTLVTLVRSGIRAAGFVGRVAPHATQQLGAARSAAGRQARARPAAARGGRGARRRAPAQAVGAAPGRARRRARRSPRRRDRRGVARPGAGRRSRAARRGPRAVGHAGAHGAARPGGRRRRARARRA
jgi:DNA polymerase-1